jgi:hypothetical protein
MGPLHQRQDENMISEKNLKGKTCQRFFIDVFSGGNPENS